MRCFGGIQPARRVDRANRDLADYIDMSLTEAVDEGDCGCRPMVSRMTCSDQGL